MTQQVFTTKDEARVLAEMHDHHRTIQSCAQELWTGKLWRSYPSFQKYLLVKAPWLSRSYVYQLAQACETIAALPKDTPLKTESLTRPLGGLSNEQKREVSDNIAANLEANPQPTQADVEDMVTMVQHAGKAESFVPPEPKAIGADDALEVVSAIRKAKFAAKRLSEGKTAVWDNGALFATLAKAEKMVRDAIPVDVCAMCEGTGCESCDGKGGFTAAQRDDEPARPKQEAYLKKHNLWKDGTVQKEANRLITVEAMRGGWDRDKPATKQKSAANAGSAWTN